MTTTPTALSSPSDKVSFGNKEIPSLFPYQLKRRDSFYHREHPKDLKPDHAKYKSYWLEQLRYYIEGRWINDEGTWVYMMPKLYYFVNYTRIYDENRRLIHPRLRDIEWIIFTYFLCMDGFSGFEGDHEFTCHHLIKEMEDGKKLDAIDRSLVPENCKKKDGSWKTYIDPWNYLTRHYLIENPAKEPLGLPLYDNPRKNAIILGCHAKGTKIRMYDGSLKNIEEVIEGDLVMGRDSKPREVVETYYGWDDLYEVKQSHGLPYTCNSQHELRLLRTQFKNKKRKKELRRKEVDVQTKDYYEGQENSKIYSRKYSSVDSELINYPRRELKLHPYFMGLWCGDGFTGYKKICGAISDTETLEWLKNYAESEDRFSYSLSYEHGGVGQSTWRFRLKDSTMSTKNNWWSNNFKGRDKYIHEDYLINSRENRLELLAGLIDSDGTYDYNKNCYVFCNANYNLIKQVFILCKSLGFKTKIAEIGKRSGFHSKNPKDKYNVIIWGNIMSIPCRIERKKAKENSHISKRGSNRKSISVEKVGYGEYFGIKVDGDNLYLLEDYTVTHNCRGISKSMCTFVGDFTHEFLTGGIHTIDELSHINSQMNFGMGCADSRQLDRSVANIKAFYDNMPGQYEYEDNVYMGPLYKKVQGAWKTGGKIQHIVKRRDQTVKISGSILQMMALTPDKTKVGAGDRFRRIYVEEIGFLSEAFEVFRSNKDSMLIGGHKVGSFVGLGTGGSIKSIQEPKTIFERVDAYDVFGIPNYWKNPDKKIGLFIPAYYASEKYKDKQGNTNIAKAYEAIMKKRDRLRVEVDADSYESEIMFNPVTPDEMLRPSGGSVLPKQAAAKQLDNLEVFDIFRNRAMIGDLQYNAVERRGVEFKKDLSGKKKPIIKWEATAVETNSEGAVIIYEQPGEIIPDGLYYVIYDPVQKSGSGSSYNSILVYKNFYRGPEDSLFDTVVAEWIGRKERLEDNYHMVIKFAKYFNAKIFPETNVAGFVEWCNSNNYYSLLESDGTWFLKQELNSKSNKSQYYKVGFQMQKREKDWALRKLRDWLLDIKRHDPVTGVPILRTMDWIFSPRILEEIIGYSEEDDYNFDHISSLLGLMILIGKLGKEPIDLEEDEDIKVPNELQAYHDMLRRQQLTLAAQPRRSKFLSY